MKITVFTPTFNRADLLKRLYKSLVIQTCKDFVWLIVDDGSSDNTKEEVAMWMKENLIEIKYIYQTNQGMFAAHNTAYKNIATELNICVDSDDYLKNDSIKSILELWNEVEDKNNLAGMIFNNEDIRGNLIGSDLPNVKTVTLYDVNHYYKVGGDKKLVYRTDVISKYRYPITKNEVAIPSTYIYYQIDLKYKLFVSHKSICVVDYQPNGLSKNERNRLISSPGNSAKFFILLYRIENRNKKNKILFLAKYYAFMHICKKKSKEKVNIFEKIPAYLISKIFLFSIYKKN